MKREVAERSKAEGYPRSRLPELSPKEIDYIRGTYDFFALNHYTTRMVDDAAAANIGIPSVDKDARVTMWSNSTWPESATSWLKVT